MRTALYLIPLLSLATTALAFDPIGSALEGAGKLNPFEFSSTTTNPAKPSPNPPEPQSPCAGETIRPDSAGNFMFNMEPGGAAIYAIQFSKNGSDWSASINASPDLAQVQGQQIPVNAGKLLLISKNWHWRTVAQAAGKTLVSKRACKIAIEPSGGVQMLPAPVLASPACASQAPGATVLFDAKPSNGKFQKFRAELQYLSASNGNWVSSGLLAAIDKDTSQFGMAIPVGELAKQAGKWRWRARLDTEKMPIFGGLTQGAWSPWCEFTVPSSVPSVNISKSATSTPTAAPPVAFKGGFAPAAPPAAQAVQPGAPLAVKPVLALPQGLPDITSQAALVIGATPAQWGASVAVSAAQAHSVNLNNSGQCEMALRHAARNTGLGASGAFGSAWQNSAVPGSFSRTWAPLAASADSTQTDLVMLKPGQNILSLTLDHLNQVKESNENNNSFQLIVNLSGNCGAAPARASPPSIVPPPVRLPEPAPQRGSLPKR